MSRLRAAVTARRTRRARLREERTLERLVAAAPTLESAHELRTLGTRR